MAMTRAPPRLLATVSVLLLCVALADSRLVSSRQHVLQRKHRLDSALALLEHASATATSLGALPQCQGLVKKQCEPCPNGGDPVFCSSLQEQCSRLFCNPMCRKDTWTCEVSFGGKFAEEKKDSGFEEALCGQFLAQGCAKVLDCCAEDDYLWDFVENAGFGDNYPTPKFPTPTCKEASEDKQVQSSMCGTCKSAVKITLTAKECAYPEVPDDTEEGGGGGGKKKASALVQTAASVSFADWSIDELLYSIQNEAHRLGLRDRPADRVPHSARMRFSQARVDAGAAAFPGEAAFKGLQERCTELSKKVNSKFSSMKSAFQKNACECMGCCEGKCFFPLVEHFELPDKGKK